MATPTELWRLLEATCGSAIPDDYVALLQAYPPQLQVAQRSSDAAADGSVVADVELLSSLSDVLEINREARLCCITDPDGEEFCWPEQLLVIGETGTGDYYCVDVSGEHQGVLQYLHQSTEFEQVAESLEEFVELLSEAFCGTAAAGGGGECEDDVLEEEVPEQDEFEDDDRNPD